MSSDFFNFTHTECVAVSKDTNKIAWIVYKSGKRTLYTATSPDFSPTVVCTSDIRDNETISSPVLSSCGYYLAFVHQKRVSLEKNITLLKVITFSADSPEHITIDSFPSGKHLCFNEKQHCIFYVQDSSPSDITTLNPQTGKQSTLTKINGEITDLRLCPNGEYLAITCQSGSRHFISIYNIEENTWYWQSQHFEDEYLPVWSPSGKALAFFRQGFCPRQENNPLPFSSYPPFSLNSLDMVKKKCRTHWDSGRSIISGRSSQKGHRPILWDDENEIIFSHEGCGWEHVYRCNIKTNEITPVSSGDFLVRDIDGCKTTGTLFFSCNYHMRHQFQIISRHKSHDSSYHTLPSRENGEVYPMTFLPTVIGNTGQYLAYIGSSEKRASQLTIMDRKNNSIFAPETDVNHSLVDPQYITPSFHTLKSRDGKSFYAQVFKRPSHKKQAAILFLHDGPGKQSLPGFQPSLEMSFQYALCQYLCRKGFVVMSINYRGSGGYNKGFREAKNRGWQGASEYDDVIAAGKWLSQQPCVDPQKTGIMGKGWGGYLAALGMAKDSQLFRAGVCVNGYYHFPRFMRDLAKTHNRKQPLPFTEMPAESATGHIARAKLAVEFSPWYFLEQWMSPVLIVHSGKNADVPFSESQHLYLSLKYHGVNVDKLVLPEENHNFIWHQSWITLAEKTVSFLNSHFV